MSTTLNLVESLLARGRSLVEQGQDHNAYHLLRKLAAFRELPTTAAEEAQALLAEIQIGRRRYARARRHLAAALGYCPHNAQYHYLMAAAVDADDEADPQRALAHYQRSLKLDPNQPTCLVDFGMLCLELGRETAGIRALRRAVRLAPEDLSILAVVVEGFCHAGREEEARKFLLAARFRNPHDPRLDRLWRDYQFQQLHQEQAISNPRRLRATRPTLLSFVKAKKAAQPAETKEPPVRRDRPSPLPRPHTPRRLRIFEPT